MFSVQAAKSVLVQFLFHDSGVGQEEESSVEIMFSKISSWIQLHYVAKQKQKQWMMSYPPVSAECAFAYTSLGSAIIEGFPLPWKFSKLSKKQFLEVGDPPEHSLGGLSQEGGNEPFHDVPRENITLVYHPAYFTYICCYELLFFFSLKKMYLIRTTAMFSIYEKQVPSFLF